MNKGMLSLCSCSGEESVSSCFCDTWAHGNFSLSSFLIAVTNSSSIRRSGFSSSSVDTDNHPLVSLGCRNHPSSCLVLKSSNSASMSSRLYFSSQVSSTLSLRLPLSLKPESELLSSSGVCSLPPYSSYDLFS